MSFFRFLFCIHANVNMITDSFVFRYGKRNVVFFACEKSVANFIAAELFKFGLSSQPFGFNTLPFTINSKFSSFDVFPHKHGRKFKNRFSLFAQTRFQRATQSHCCQRIVYDQIENANESAISFRFNINWQPTK